jgi:cytochrome c oxidase cbb3-type subunit III
MAQETDELLDHDYDGIKEYDNPLPRWWLWLFYGTVVFAALYLPYYLLGFGATSAEMYQQELAEARQAYPQAAAMAPAAPAAPAQAGAAQPGAAPTAAPAAASLADASMVGNPQAIAEGKTIFLANCMPCHGDKGQGLIGPNLTDKFWLHGNKFPDIVNTITHGVPDKGMISWQATLNPSKINQVAAFVMSIRGSNPPNPKPPQGQEYPD